MSQRLFARFTVDVRKNPLVPHLRPVCMCCFLLIIRACCSDWTILKTKTYIKYNMYIVYSMWKGDSDSYSNPNLETSQKFSIKKEKDNSEDGMKSFELCSNPHNFPGKYSVYMKKMKKFAKYFTLVSNDYKTTFKQIQIVVKGKQTHYIWILFFSYFKNKISINGCGRWRLQH